MSSPNLSDEDFLVLDPMMVPYWHGADASELIIQKCADCAAYQFYPRPFCLHCGSSTVFSVNASGQGRIYSMTTVRSLGTEELQPPYVVALVELEEGPRLLTNIVGAPCAIDDPVELTWGTRLGRNVPLFRPAKDANGKA